MPISRSLFGLMIAGVLATSVPGHSGHAAEASRVAAKEAVQYKSPAAALQAGLTAYKRGDYASALPALEFAAAGNVLLAQYALAQLYSDNAGPETDHAKAYMLYQSIADEYADADPDDDKRAPLIAKSLTALAGYLRVGIPEIGLNADYRRAADYLHHAALFFGDEDAQFELVKMKLKGEGIPEDIANAKHWLAVLTQRGHAGAQAFLADLYWRGKFMQQDKIRAFALIAVAVEHAPPRERIWIEDVYQNIFCGAGEGIRKQATGMVAEWRTRYGRKAEDSAPAGLDPLYPLAVRTCQNGDKVTPLNVKSLDAGQQPSTQPAYTTAGALPGSPPATTGGLRDIGSKTTEAPPTAGLPTPGLASGLMSNPSPDAR